MTDRSREATFRSEKALARIAQILALLPPRKRLSSAEIGTALGISVTATGEYLRYLRGVNKRLPHERVLRIAAWRQIPGTTQLAPLYAQGKSQDAPRPRMAKGQRDPLAFTLKTTVDKLNRIRTAFKELGPMTAVELENIQDRKYMIFASSRRIRDSLQFLRGLHKTAPGPREVHISGWKKQGESNGRRAPIYALGDLPDVPEPKRTKAQQRAHDRNRRKKEMKDPARREAIRAGQRMARLRRAGKLDQMMPDEMALLFGRRKQFDMEYYATERPRAPVLLQLLVRQFVFDAYTAPKRRFQ